MKRTVPSSAIFIGAGDIMAIELGILLTVASVIIGYLGYQLNKQNQRVNQITTVKQESQQDARLQTQLDYISRGVDDIRIDLKANEKQIVQLGERVTRIEESSKQAHKRIDKMEEIKNEN